MGANSCYPGKGLLYRGLGADTEYASSISANRPCRASATGAKPTTEHANTPAPRPAYIFDKAENTPLLKLEDTRAKRIVLRIFDTFLQPNGPFQGHTNSFQSEPKSHSEPLGQLRQTFPAIRHTVRPFRAV